MRIRKGPYFADDGDFSSAGALHIDYIDTLYPGLIQGTGGMFGYGRGLAIKSVAMGAGNLLVAGEGTVYDGPWVVPDRMRKLNGVVRYSQGTALEGFSITGMAYDNRWTSTDQVAKRAIDRGLIDRFGTLDPTDGGRSSRYSISTRMSMLNDWGLTKLEAYGIRYTMTLFNNFTYFLDDPVNGDQFSQLDSRNVYGVHGNHTFRGRLGPFESETRVGIQSRYDDIDVGLNKTRARRTLSTVRTDDVQEGSNALYVQNTTHWTPWLRSIVGGRGDWYQAKVDSNNPLNSGSAHDFIASPKGSLIIGPFDEDRAVPQCRLRLPLQRRARSHYHHRSQHRAAGRQGAVPGARQGRRGRRAQQEHRRTGNRGRAVRAGLRLRALVRRRRRHHRSEPPEPPRRRRMDQPLHVRCPGSRSTSTSR